MDLRSFVRATLEEISSAVREAQAATRGSGAVINPCVNAGVETDRGNPVLKSGAQMVSTIEFDIALSGQTRVGATGRSVLLEANPTSADDSATRVRFSVPVLLPKPRSAPGNPRRPSPEASLFVVENQRRQPAADTPVMPTAETVRSGRSAKTAA